MSTPLPESLALRRHILLALGLAAGATGCGPAVAVRSAEDGRRPAPAEGPVDVPSSPPPAAVEPPINRANARFSKLDFGAHRVCLPLDEAREIAVDRVLDLGSACPIHVEPVLRLLSQTPIVSRFEWLGFEEGQCCYGVEIRRHRPRVIIGRPMLEAGEAVVATLTPDGAPGWSGEDMGRAAALPPEARAQLAGWWLADALMEHASVAAFSRVALQLMTLEAPGHLVEATHTAALDEIHHARLSFAMARHYSGELARPGAVPVPAFEPPSLETLAVETFDEGCVGETIAALIARRQLRRCGEPEARAALEVIARDEADHAALAWQTVAWAVERGGATVRAALHQAMTRLRREAEAVASAPSEPPPLPEALMDTHGRLSDAAIRDTHREAWEAIIEPTWRALQRGW